jgi:chemotaxis protein MotB
VLSSTEASSGGSSLLNGAGSSLVERIRNEFQQVQSEIDALRGSGPTTGSVAVEVNREGILISMYGNFLFDPGKASLNDDALVALDKIAALLLGSSNAIRVEGHTDNIAPDSVLYPSNWELSSARATSVVRHLIKDGIDPARLQAVGYGETRPLNANRTREDRARNRRVDIQIIYPQAINLSDADISSLQRGP